MVHLFTLAFCCELSLEPFHEVLPVEVGVDLLVGKPHRDAEMGAKKSISLSFLKRRKEGKGRECRPRDTFLEREGKHIANSVVSDNFVTQWNTNT